MDNNTRIAASAAFRKSVARAGSQSAFSRQVGILQQTVSNLLARGDVLPAEFVLRAEESYGVSRHVLRPDIYPAVATSASSHADDHAITTGHADADFDRDGKMKRGGQS